MTRCTRRFTFVGVVALALLSVVPLRAAGSWAPLGSGITGTMVTTLHEWNGKLVVLGDFSTSDSSASNIALWDGTTWSAVGGWQWGHIDEIATYNGQLAALGTRADSTGKEIAVWDGSSWNTLIATSYARLATCNGNIYQSEKGVYPATGNTWSRVLQFDGRSWHQIGFWSADAREWDSEVTMLTEMDNRLYVTIAPFGEISWFDGAAWTSLGTTGMRFGLGIARIDSVLYVGGRRPWWTTSSVQRWNGSIWNLIMYSDCLMINALVGFGGELVAAGGLNGCTSSTIRRWNGITWSDMGLTNGSVLALAVVNGTLVAAGAFTSVDGVSAPLIAEYLSLPTPVAIASFSVSQVNGAVSLSWDITADETFSGFDIYRREVGGSDTRVNASRLSPSARSYVDRTATPGTRYSYQLVAVGAASGEFRSQRAEITLPALSATLRQNVPNPFNPETTIRFVVPSENQVSIAVYGAHGEKVRTLVERRYAPGEWAATWDGTDDAGRRVASGVYYYRMRIGSLEQSKKMVLIK